MDEAELLELTGVPDDDVLEQVGVGHGGGGPGFES